MITRLVWNRIRRDWRHFAGISVWTLFSGAPLVVLILPLVGAWFLGSRMSTQFGSGAEPTSGADAAAMMRTGVIITLVFVAGFIAFIALMQAGLMALVVAFRREEQVGFRTFWTGVRRHWVPLLLPAVFWGGLSLFSRGSLLHDPMRHAGTELVIALLTLHLGIYPAYLIVADDMGGLSAVGRGLRILVARPLEALSGVLLLWAVQMAVSLLGHAVSQTSPWLLLPWAIFLLFYVSLVPYYFAERYEQNLRPILK